jgi:nonribosomal peptide synthetase DhbF
MHGEADPADAAIAVDLMELWKQLLRVSNLEPDDDFFQLGGNSMLVVRMLGTVSSRFGVTLDVVRFLQRPTIRTLSTLLAFEVADPPRRGGPD